MSDMSSGELVEAYRFLTARIDFHTAKYSRRVLNRLTDDEISVRATRDAQVDLGKRYDVTVSELMTDLQAQKNPMRIMGL